ncbi:hypothetical protein MUK42_34489 [Musa troglodytarum]|uniref:Uncharacterized protein n=1 Tax=Musa troglodytarum TaxID=320322 RepID=A0A9E7HUU5_9LILI|nr:hypothetical protein MUK42_34489 [Musa troglodytarum]
MIPDIISSLDGEGSSVVSPSSLLSVSPASSDEPKIYVDIGELCDQLFPSLGGDTMVTCCRMP